ncbi:acyl-CoA dehydrogenase family protein [Nesterenkonia sphaerica]|uniref:Acyl-CoA dehydrogenase family protein n=1 Tax=Nesterenkonia sphaerica TaxID=1804988 RepID=A0A5R9AN39_9MICC|nr:acyl-CoA dehydrogenase family protein [Nesterenkonia sphaerica]TLP79316.1 acyl-CoA dehydrogenase family protein [Nesterenkonia sphaerica]
MIQKAPRREPPSDDDANRRSRAELDHLVHRVEDFIRDVVIPAEPAPGQYLELPVRDELRAAAKAARLFAPHVSSKWGGIGLPLSQWPEVFEAAGYSPIGPVVLNCMAPDEGNMHMLEQIATPEQKRQFLEPLARGHASSCFGMTEPHPGAGSDPSQLSTTAERSSSGWVINGEKRFSSGANLAEFMIAMARTGEVGEATMFLVPMDTPGMTITRQINTVDRVIDGGHPHVEFNNVSVPDSAVLGEPHRGMEYAQVRLGPARLTHCMRWLGLARRSQDIALDRAHDRSLFGSRLDEQGLAQELIAQSEIDIEASRSLIQRTATLLEEDNRAGTRLSSVAKVFCSEAIYRVIDRSIQLCGGDGVSDDLPLAQYLNEVRPFRIYDGSTETHKWAIARRASRRRARERQRRHEQPDGQESGSTK